MPNLNDKDKAAAAEKIQVLQKQTVEVKPSKLKGAGFGLFALVDFKANQNIGEYTGEKKKVKKSEDELGEDHIPYCIQINKHEFIDAYNKQFSSLMRYVNDVNLGIIKGNLVRTIKSNQKNNSEFAKNGKTKKIHLVATVAIAKGEEIYADYQSELTEPCKHPMLDVRGEGVIVQQSQLVFNEVGLFATREFKVDETVIEYTGERLTYDEADERTDKTYQAKLSTTVIIDAKDTPTALARYINRPSRGMKSNVGLRQDTHNNRLIYKCTTPIHTGDEILGTYGRSLKYDIPDIETTHSMKATASKKESDEQESDEEEGYEEEKEHQKRLKAAAAKKEKEDDEADRAAAEAEEEERDKKFAKHRKERQKKMSKEAKKCREDAKRKASLKAAEVDDEEPLPKKSKAEVEAERVERGKRRAERREALKTKE